MGFLRHESRFNYFGTASTYNKKSTALNLLLSGESIDGALLYRHKYFTMGSRYECTLKTFSTIDNRLQFTKLNGLSENWFCAPVLILIKFSLIKLWASFYSGSKLEGIPVRKDRSNHC